LRAGKNRSWATDEVGAFEMTEQGVVAPVTTPRLFLAHRPTEAFGSAVCAAINGSTTRPLLVEVQSLVNFSSLGLAMPWAWIPTGCTCSARC
jgi:DNA repair protein RadA/Sms